MKIFLISLFISLSISGYTQTRLEFEEPIKQRVFILTDITNEPDDQQSLVRFLVYSNEYEIEGMVATTSTHLRKNTRKDKIEELVQSYGKIKDNLDKHDKGFPSMEYLLSVTSEHLPLYSMDGVGDDKDSPGSELLIAAVDKADNRPLWVSVWGGANCLAQALWKVKNTRSEEEVEQFVSKLRIYTISDQDLAGHWVRHTFPGIFYIVDASSDGAGEYYEATWSGIGGDRFYKNGPMMDFELVDNPWLKENIMENHGPLGANYLEVVYIMEGDSPSFLGLINNGLAWYKSPSFGGWGGRYEWYNSFGEVSKIWTGTANSRDSVVMPDGKTATSNQATIWRWRKAYQHDFAARMDWNVADEYQNGNHNPILVLNGNEGKGLAEAVVNAGETVSLSAKGSRDPDGDQLRYKWIVYKEAGRFTGDLDFHNPYGEELQFEMPKLGKGQSLHIILEVEDSGNPSLFAYRRIVLKHAE